MSDPSEIQNMTRLQHPHIVKVHDAGVERELPYVVVEHLGGGSLGDRLREAGGRQRPEEILAWLNGAGLGVQSNHRGALRSAPIARTVYEEVHRLRASIRSLLRSHAAGTAPDRAQVRARLADISHGT